MKALLLCSSGPLGLKVLYCLHQMKIHVETAGPDGAGILKYSRYTKHHAFFPFGVTPELFDNARNWLIEYARNQSFDIVISSDIPSAEFLAQVKKQHPDLTCFPCSGIDVLEALHNKWSFAQVCETHGLPSPKTVLIESVESLSESKFDDIGFPLILKPLEAESSHGVVMMDSYSKLLEYLRSGARYSSMPQIAQTYIPGSDIDISILAADGKLLCSTVQSWVEDGVLEFTHNQAMVEIAEKLVHAFNYEGLAHFDMRIDSRTNALYVIECNPRPWYTISASMWQGLNFIETGIQYTLDKAIPKIDDHAGEGIYCLAGSLPKQLFPIARWKNITMGSFKGFFQAMSDPLPHLFQKLNNR